MAAPGRKGRARALDVLGRLGPVEPEVFAKEMWPRARSWGEPSVMREVGRARLEKLRRVGIVTKTEFGYLLTAAGLDMRDRLTGT